MGKKHEMTFTIIVDEQHVDDLIFMLMDSTNYEVIHYDWKKYPSLET